MAQLTIGEGGDVAWTPASTTAAGYPGIGLRAVANAHTPDADSKFLFHLDESSWDGTANEVKNAVSGGTNATAHNGASTAAGWFNRAGEFDGYNDRVLIPQSDTYNLPAADDCTFDLWFKDASVSAQVRFAGMFEGTQFLIAEYTGSNTLRFVMRSDNSTWRIDDALTLPFTPDGKWHHMSGAVDKTLNKGYLSLDGTWTSIDLTGTGTSKAVSFTIPIGIGAVPWRNIGTYLNFWPGLIDEVQWSHTLRYPKSDFTVSRWRYLSGGDCDYGGTPTSVASGIGCSAIQAVDLGEKSKIAGVSWAEATVSSDERLQSIEVDDGAGYKTVWTYGGAVDVSGLAAASTYNLRITQRHSTDTVHEFAHILESITLDYSAAATTNIPIFMDYYRRMRG